MNKKDTNAEQNEETQLKFSDQLELIGALLNIIGEGLGAWAVLEALEEEKIADEQENQDQNRLNDKLRKMQDQIDQLAKELADIKGIPRPPSSS